ncbi:MAG: DNA polymerase III subunit beta [Candidatus Margulisbacteria bacterium]|nr:DNA polymerase III subunit beta [Candidatus Margulisiibacteriota bacterium]
MDFVCEKKDLQSAVSAVEKIVTTRSTLPIIGNILFEAGKGSLQISANNLEIGIELGIKAKVNKGGAILMPAKTLGGIVAKLPNRSVGFKLSEKGTIKVSYDQSYFNVHTLPPDEFPILPKVKAGKSFTIDVETFSSMIRQTIFAVSASEEKYVLTGVLLETGKGSIPGDTSNIRMVSTDGYRLAKRGEKIKTPAAETISVIVPGRALQELVRLIDGEEGEAEVKVVVSADQISFKCNDVYLVSRLIQGQFPDYKQVIPKKSATKITVETKALLEASERAAVIAAGSANIVRFEVKGEKLHLAASTPDVGSIDEIVPAEVVGEKKIQVSFNIRLITDLLKAVETERVVIELTEVLGPGVIKPEKKDNYIYIVMPIRTQEAA